MSEQLPNTRTILRAGAPATLGALTAVAAILAMYFLMPGPSGDDPPWLVFIFIVIVSIIYSAAGVWALFRINRSKHPGRTGITLLAVMVTAIVTVFALAYLSLSAADQGNFNVPLDKVSALYFTMTILTTVGFGDIHADSHSAMIAVMVQMVLSLTLITTLGRVLMETSRRVTRARMQNLDQAD